MAKANDKQCATLLSGLGFTAESRQTWTHWLLPVPATSSSRSALAGSSGRPGRSKQRLTSPWSIRALEVAERKGALTLHRVDVSLDRQTFHDNLAILTKRYFGVRTSGEVVEGRDDELWCLFEFQRPGTRDRDGGGDSIGHDAPPSGPLPYGIGGFSVRLAAEGMTASVIVSGFFGVGYLPGDFSHLPLRFVRDALGLREPEAVVGEFFASSIYEWTFPTYLPALAVLAQSAGEKPVIMLGAQLGVAKLAADTVLIRDRDAIRVVSPGDDSALSPHATPMEQAALTRLPVEVLEARERAARCRDIDAAILAGKTALARSLLHASIEAEPSALYLLRRLALLGLCGRRERAAAVVERCLKLEPEHELFLSYAAAAAADAGDRATALVRLSSLGARLTGLIPGSDRLRCFDVVLPEALGDAWIGEDLGKAADCYHRVIERRGESPRLLRKLIHIARTTGRAEVEIGLLTRLARVERRKLELAKIYLRHAELRRMHATGRDEALELALRALRLDRRDERAAVLASELLAEKGKPNEAVQLLDALVRDGSVSMPGRARARLYAELARVWEKHLGRPDLAETRYEQAVEHDRRDIAVLKSLEAIYRRSGDLAKLSWILEIEFEAFETLEQGDALRAVFDELAVLYRGALARPTRAYELYQRLVASVATAPEEIDRVLAWRDVEIDWRDLYGRLIANLPALDKGEHRAQYLCRLAEICRDRLDDGAAAQRHLLAALEDGWIDAGGFRFLVERLGAAGDHATLVRCYELRIEQVSSVQRRELLLELLQVPQFLSDARRDQIALAAYLLDTKAPGVLLQRFRRYQQIDDVAGMRKLVALILSEKGVPSAVRSGWIHSSIEAATGFVDEERYGLIDELFRELLEAGEDEKPVLSEAMNALRDARESGRLLFYVTRALQVGMLPPLEERLVLRLLSGSDLDLALYHQLMSLSSTKPEIAAVNARTAAALYAKREKQESNTEAMLARLCALVPCAEDDLAQLKSLVESSGNFAALARALQKQADFEDEKGRKFRLLEQLAYVYWKNMRDYARARLTLVLAIKLAPEPARIKLLLAHVAADAGDAKAERKALSDFLLDAQCVADTPAISAAVARLLKLGEERRLVQRLVAPHVDKAMQQSQPDLAGRIAQALIDHDAASTETFRIAFRAAVDVRDDARARTCWWRGLASVGDTARAKAFMSDTRHVLEREDRKDLLIECYQEGLQQRIGDRLGPKIKREILIQYGALLFDSDAKRDKALAVYVEACRGDPDDNRTWMPLYFLLQEFGSPLERLRHLTEIVSKLERDPRPLKNFPITIESLRAELKELESELLSDVAPTPATAHAKPNQSVIGKPRDHGAGISSRHSPELELSVDTPAPHYDDVAAPAPHYDDAAAPAPHYDFDVSLASVAGEAPGFGRIEARQSGRGTGVASTTGGGHASPASGFQGRYFSVVDGKPLMPDAAAVALPGLDGQAGGTAAEVETPAAATAEPEALPLPAIPSPGIASIEASEELPHLAPGQFSLEGGAVLDLGAAAQPLPPPPAKLRGVRETGDLFDMGVLSDDPVSSVDLAIAIDHVYGAANGTASGADGDPSDGGLPDGGSVDGEQSGGNLPTRHHSDGGDPDLSHPDSENAQSFFAAASAVDPVESASIDVEATRALVAPSPLNDAPALQRTASDVSMSDAAISAAHELRLHAKASDTGRFSRAALPAEESQLAPGAESGDSGVTNRSAGLFAGIEGGHDDVADWRAAVIKGDFNADLTGRLLTQAFASEIEKHLAIQTVAIVAGNCDQLSSWHWRVWRKPEEYGYRISAAERFPEELRSPLLDSSLMKLVAAMGGVLTRSYRKRFTLEHIAGRLEMLPTAIEKLRKPMDWNSRLLKEVGMPLLANRIASRNFLAYNLTGLEREIFYDGAARAFYIDETYYKKAPPSHLFHRLSGMMWAVHARYFVPLMLHPQNQFMPVMREVHQAFSSNGLSRLRSRLAPKSPLGKVLASIDMREIRSHHEKTGMPTEDQVVQLWEAMRQHLHRLQIAETLDVIGLFESITDKDLLKPGVLSHSQIYELWPPAKQLLEFITKLGL